MKLFGLTGGVGMGKSAAAQCLRDHGLPVIDTDLLARQVVEPGQPALSEIQSVFGKNIVGPDGRLRRDQLAQIVFSDPDARRKLEALTHPRIRGLWKKQIETWRAEQRPVGIVVIPLLFETGAETEFDATVCVACSAATQRQRLSERGWSRAQMDQRVAAQLPVEQKIARSNYVVWTEGDLAVLSEQLAKIFKW